MGRNWWNEPHCIEIIEKLPKNDFNIMMLDAPANPYNLVWDYDGEEKKGRLGIKTKQ